MLTSISLHTSAGVPVACFVSDSRMAARTASGSSERLFGTVAPIDAFIPTERCTTFQLNVTCGRTSRGLVSARMLSQSKTVAFMAEQIILLNLLTDVAGCPTWAYQFGFDLLLQQSGVEPADKGQVEPDVARCRMQNSDFSTVKHSGKLDTPRERHLLSVAMADMHAWRLRVKGKEKVTNLSNNACVYACIRLSLTLCFKPQR